MTKYGGMRWLRCDFQVQTPEDAKHWSDAETRLMEPRNEPDLQHKASEYLRRCHSVGLHVIGVTDHNFSSRVDPRQWFLTHLIEQNKSVAEELGREPLCIFPGFEIDIGHHILCLFEPVKKGSELARINDVLTTLGLAPTARFNSGVPTQLRHDSAPVALRTILNKVQREAGGIVIAAHAFSNRGICNDSSNIADYRIPELLCVEVAEFPLKPKPEQILKGLDQNWRRVGSQPAYIMSSDAKSLKVDDEGKPTPNSLGYRSSWLKMSSPSIESLRQAFLDNESRIRLCEPCPSDGEEHPRIISVRVKGAAFLEDHEMHFSPNLNCIIGGRGSGKSSLLEYLRFALEADTDDSLPDDIKQKHTGIYSTLEGVNAELHVTFESVAGVSDTVVFKPSEGVHRIEGREVVDLKTVLEQLQVQFFSQGELSRLTKPGQNHVLRLVDSASSAKLQPLIHQESSLKSDLEQLALAGHGVKLITAEIQRVSQEVTELNRQWQARKDIQSDALAHQKAQLAEKHANSIKFTLESDVQSVNTLAAKVGKITPTRPPEASEWPKFDWLQKTESQISAARIVLQNDLQDASDKFLKSFETCFSGESEWPAVKEELRMAELRFHEACNAKGLKPDDVSRLKEVDRVRQTKQEDLELKRQQLEKMQLQVASRSEKLTALHAIWRKQFEVRRTACNVIQGQSNATAINVFYMRDVASFKSAWNRLSPKDNRTRLGKNWDEIGGALFSSHLGHPTVNAPWELVEKWRNTPGDVAEEDVVLVTHLQDLLKHLDSDDVRATWESVRITRIDDYVDVELKRADGTSAGHMSGAGGKLLSEGQRNTALLNIMLAQGKGPIVIDQPEDELDSNYIFSDLVPLLREAKEKRQLILATHNANLPVNADAEVIYAVEARDSRGKKRAEGGLDCADVTLSVLDIMEGSERAFKRRSDKYHF